MRSGTTTSNRQRRRGTIVSIAAVALLLALMPGVASGSSVADDPGSYTVEVLSGRPDTVSGGDALVSIRPPRGVAPKNVVVRLGDEDLTGAFAPGLDGTLVGIVDGLALGDNTVDVTERTRNGEVPGTSFQLSNHHAAGPVFSGPHIPFWCTAQGSPWNLGPVDEYCHVEGVEVTYLYRTTTNQFVTLPEGPLPDNLATTTTNEGNTVPYIVRRERGTINRAVYETAVLHEPGTPLPDPWTKSPGYNQKLVYTFGGACGISFWQANSTGGVMNHTFLSLGYGVASATLNVYANNCNDVTSAETAMMVKEHFIETHGPVKFTMGSGGSAGTMQQLLISNAYPGILDGVLGSAGYPDERSITVNGHHCRFLTGYWNSTSTTWTTEERRAVTGFATPNTCFGFMFFDGVDYPLSGCPGAVPVSARYHPVNNPTGIRCTIADMTKAIYGEDAQGFGRRIIPDNVGLQYGLGALNDGVISKAQFIEMNDAIGGIDIDGTATAERVSADPIALERAYATGRVNRFDGGLSYIPMIETRGYSDLGGDFHDRHRSWMMRARQLAANGDAGTHVSLTGPPSQNGTMNNLALEKMDEWLTQIAEFEDTRPRWDARERAVRSRPAGLVDGCYTATGDFVAEEITRDPAAECNQLYPYHMDPHSVAGGTLAGDILKCTLKPLDASDYEVTFTTEEWSQLQAVFPDGVCDWSKPGVGMVPLEGVWLEF